MVAAFESIGAAQVGNISSFSFSHTIGGTNRHAIVVIGTSGANASSVQVGATTCSLIAGSRVVTGSQQIELWETDSEPATGANTVTGNLSAMGHTQVNSINYEGVDTSGPTSGLQTSTGNAATTSTSAVTSAADDLVMDGIRGDEDPAEDGSQANQWAGSSAGNFTESSTKAGAASVTMVWTFTTSDFAHAAVNIVGGGAPANVGVIGVDQGADRHYQHEDFSATILDSYITVDTRPTGITWDGTDIIGATLDPSALGRHSLHTGFSATIQDSYTTVATSPRDLVWDGRRIYASSNTANSIYQHAVGFSATIENSFPSPGSTPRGLAWDRVNILSSDGGGATIYKHSGFSATITDSFASPDLAPEGIAWDDTNLLSAANDIADKHYLHDGFSATITDSYAAPGAEPDGLEWEDRTYFRGRIFIID